MAFKGTAQIKKTKMNEQGKEVSTTEHVSVTAPKEESIVPNLIQAIKTHGFSPRRKMLVMIFGLEGEPCSNNDQSRSQYISLV